MRLDPAPRLPAEPDQFPLKVSDLFRNHARQVNDLTEGRMAAITNSATAIPTTGTYAKGDVLRNSNPSEAGPTGAKYVIYGWLCTVGGTPGTWVELRIGTGTIYETIQMSVSDLTTALTTGTNKAYARAPHAMTITTIRASLLTVSSSGAVTVDVNINGTTILSTKLTIDASEKTSVTAATALVLSSTAIADDDEISVDIDGAGTGAKGLIVAVIGTLA